jgi:hypothetical protein
LPCGIANQPKKKIASQNPHLTFQVCAQFPWLFEGFCQAFMALHYLLPLHTLLFEGFCQAFMALHYLLPLHTLLLERFCQAFMALHYLLPLHTLLSEGYFSSFHPCSLSAAAHLASSIKFPRLCTICCCCAPPCTKEAVPNSRFHGTCTTTQKSILKSFESSSLSAA